MYLVGDDEAGPAPRRAPFLVAAVVICAGVTLALGVAPGPVLELAQEGLGIFP